MKDDTKEMKRNIHEYQTAAPNSSSRHCWSFSRFAASFCSLWSSLCSNISDFTIWIVPRCSDERRFQLSVSVCFAPENALSQGTEDAGMEMMSCVLVELIGFSFSFSAIPTDHYLLSNMNIYHYIQSEQYTPPTVPNPLQVWFSGPVVQSGLTRGPLYPSKVSDRNQTAPEPDPDWTMVHPCLVWSVVWSPVQTGSHLNHGIPK